MSPTNNQPTNIMEIPTHYISVRLTVNHEHWDDVARVLSDYDTYVAYPHVGKATEKQHFHIFVPGTDAKECEKLRNRFKRAFNDGGNKFISVKFMSNGILNSITYGSREGTTPHIKGDDAEGWVEQAPAWEHREVGIGGHFTSRGYRPPKEDHFLMITFRNIEKACLKYRQSKGIRSDKLEDVLAKMHEDGWRLDRSFLTHGINHTIFEQFTKACNGETVYVPNRFLRMRKVDSWDTFGH